MPYVDTTARQLILAGHPPQTCGELNFLLTMLGIRHAGRDSELVVKWARAAERYVSTKGLSYQTINDVLGAFTGAGWEFRRREGGGILKALLDVAAGEFYHLVAAPYEDTKIVANGDLPYAHL